MNFDHVHNLMLTAVADGVFPGGVLLASRQGSIAFVEAYGLRNIDTKKRVTTETVFDLASLTKPLATTPAVMLLVERRRLMLDQALGSVLEGFAGSDKEALTVEQLLRHTAGLPDYRPFYRELAGLPMEKRREALLEAILRTPLRPSGDRKELYSDLGFMLLGHVVEALSGERLDRFVDNEIYIPLGLTTADPARLRFVDITAPAPIDDVAATEVCPWRKKLLQGLVHDENAYALGGIAGHAGLFGSAWSVHEFVAALWRIHQGRQPGGPFSAELMRQFWRRGPGNGRPLGFDAPADTGSSSGRFFSPNTVGHLGFTGTSFWLDIDRAVIVILLTNRIHPQRDNDRIKDFRPKIHDAIMKSLLGIK